MLFLRGAPRLPQCGELFFIVLNVYVNVNYQRPPMMPFRPTIRIKVCCIKAQARK